MLRVLRWRRLWAIGLCLVVCLGAALWGWVRWPERTLSRFLELIQHGQYLQANAMFGEELAWEQATEWGLLRLEWKPGNRSDVLLVNTLEQTHRDKPWLRLRAESRDVLVLPNRVWAAWLDRRQMKVGSTYLGGPDEGAAPN
jgi:hypothetical protein